MSEAAVTPSTPQLSALNARHPTAALNVLLLLFIFNFTLQPLTEPDFGWHLRTGLDLLQQGLRLPAFDLYSHTMPDWPWIEHAWLTDVVIGTLYRLGGGWCVILFFGVVAAGAWILASRIASCGMTARLSACVLSLWVALPYLGARTQLVSLLGLALVMNILLRPQAPDGRWWLPPLFLLWANLHGGFTAGLALLGLALLSAWVVRAVVARQPQLAARIDEQVWSFQDLKQLTVIGGLSVLVTLVNPYGWHLYTEIADSLSNRFMIDNLQEWQPPALDTVAGRSYAWYLGGLFMAMLCWYRRVEPIRWTLWVVFLYLSLRHMRNIPIFLILTVPLCAELLATGSVKAGRAIPSWKMGSTWWVSGAMCLAGALLFWLGAEHLQHVAQAGMQPAQFFRGTSYPMEAVEWVRSHRERIGRRMFNEYGYGGFLLWWLPEEKIFIDGRMPAWHVGERRIFEDYVALTESDPPDLIQLQKYKVDWALVRRDGRVALALEADPLWERLYQDDKVSIYTFIR